MLFRCNQAILFSSPLFQACPRYDGGLQRAALYEQ